MNPTECETLSTAAADAPPAPGIDPPAATVAAPLPGFGSSASSTLLTPEQLALRLSVSRRCLGNWTRDRVIPMIKIGRVCRFDLPQVLAALEKHVQGVATR